MKWDIKAGSRGERREVFAVVANLPIGADGALNKTVRIKITYILFLFPNKPNFQFLYSNTEYITKIGMITCIKY